MAEIQSMARARHPQSPGRAPQSPGRDWNLLAGTLAPSKQRIGPKEHLIPARLSFPVRSPKCRKQTVAARDAAKAAQEAASAASTSAEAASRQVAAIEEQTNTAIDALRLDQRPWLGYERHVMEARANSTSSWEQREPKTGEQSRVRLYVQNIGKTPALNVRLMSTPPILIHVGARPSEPEGGQWSIVEGEFVVSRTMMASATTSICLV